MKMVMAVSIATLIAAGTSNALALPFGGAAGSEPGLIQLAGNTSSNSSSNTSSNQSNGRSTIVHTHDRSVRRSSGRSYRSRTTVIERGYVTPRRAQTEGRSRRHRDDD